MSNIGDKMRYNIKDYLSKKEVDKLLDIVSHRSEERRVGKECRSRCSPYH